MIAIKYSGSKLPKLDALCNYLQKKIEVWVKADYVGNNGSGEAMDPDARKFFNVLNHPTAIRRLVNMPASRLIWLIDMMEKHFPQLKTDRENKEKGKCNSLSPLYKCICKAFSSFGYDSDLFSAEELMEDLDLTVCPYCNRNFIKAIEVKPNGVFVRGQLDHFYPRSLYPYLAVCKHNLVPSCPSCNGASGKHLDNTRTKGVVNPYMLTDSNGMKFKMSVAGKGFADLRTCAKAISIDIDCTTNPALDNNEDLFHLKKLYATHTDYAAEVYYKSILSTPNVYRKYVAKKLTNNGLKHNDVDFERLLLSIYTKEEDFHKRPLSKFCADIARQSKLIP